MNGNVMRRYSILMLLGSVYMAGRALSQPIENVSKGPLYSLRTGEEITYTSQLESVPGMRLGVKDCWRIWVVHVNPDGSWGVVVRHDRSNLHGARRLMCTLTRLTLSADGRWKASDRLLPGADPSQLLVCVPNSGATESSCENVDTLTGTRSRYKRADTQASPGQLTIQIQQEGCLPRVFGEPAKVLAYFDLQRGLIGSVESYVRDSSGATLKKESVVTLQGITQKDPKWTGQLEKEAGLCVDAVQAYYQRLWRSQAEPNIAESLLPEALAALKAAGDQITLPEVREVLDYCMEEYGRSVLEYEDRARRLRSILNRPSPEWEGEDLEQRVVRKSDFRGKAVVLNFWTRSCGWSIVGLSQANEASKRLAGRPVAFVGSAYCSETDAKFVVGALKVPWPTLAASNLSDTYGLRPSPMSIVIDPEGIVRHIYCGLPPDLPNQLVAKVEEILVRSGM